MRQRVLSTVIAISVFLCGGIVKGNGFLRAQEPEATAVSRDSQDENKTAAKPEGKASSDQARQELFNRVIDLLRSVADSAKKWENKTAAARVQAQIANLTWEADPEIARGYLLQAWETAGTIEEENHNPSPYRNKSSRTDARREVLAVARKRDPDLAKKWLTEMAEQFELEKKERKRGVFDDRTPRSTVLLQMAMSAAAQDPKNAAELAIESLGDGISFGLQHVLLAIQESDFELAQKVFRAALSRLRIAGMSDPNELLILYAYLYTPGRVIAANTSENRGRFPLGVSRNRPRITIAAELNPALAAEFLKVAADSLLNAPLPSATSDPVSAARSHISAIGLLMRKMSESLPEQAEALRRRAHQIEVDAQFSPTPAALPPDRPLPREGESRQDYAERRIDLLEENAKKESSPLRRDILYAQAALAAPVESYERGWNLARNIQDQSLQSAIINLLAYRAALHYASSNDLEKVYELSEKNGDLVQRTACLVVGAQKLVSRNDKIRAAEWLQEARSLIKKADFDEDWLRITLGVAAVYARFDTFNALWALEDAVKIMDKIAATSIDGERAPLVKRFSGIEVPDFTYGTKGFGLNSVIEAIGVTEFENVLHILDQIKNPEMRGAAILTLCRRHLQSASNAPAKSSRDQSLFRTQDQQFPVGLQNLEIGRRAFLAFALLPPAMPVSVCGV